MGQTLGRGFALLGVGDKQIVEVIQAVMTERQLFAIVTEAVAADDGIILQ